MEVVSGDLRDSFFCEKITKNIDAIFHLGALIAIPYSYTAPQSYVDTNVNGTLNMLEAAKKKRNFAFYPHLNKRSLWHGLLCAHR